MVYYVIACSLCNRFFSMEEIKSDYKNCPFCGRRINWKKSHRRLLKTKIDAKNLVIYMNRKNTMDNISLKDLLKKKGE